MTRLQLYFGALLSVALLTPAHNHAHEELPICAVVEIDSDGQQWINGVAADIDSIMLRQCGESSILLIAPDYWAPTGAVIRTASEIESLNLKTKMFLPSVRREVEELFGFDTLVRCNSYSTREIEPVPPRTDSESNTITVVVAPAASEGIGYVVTVRADEATPFGVVDDSAGSSEALRDSRRVHIVLESHGLELSVDRDDIYIPPPPFVERAEDGSVVFVHDDFDICPYPATAKTIGE